MIKKKRKKKSTGKGTCLSPKDLFIQNVQHAHQQTGLKNFPEAVRLYSLAIQYLLQIQHYHSPISPYFINNNINNSSLQIPIVEKKLELPEGGIGEIEIKDNTHTPLYVLYGCRSQAYQGMQQFDLALKDAESSIHCNPNHALAYAQKGKALYSLKRHKEALKCYEEGLKMADPNHAGLRRLVEIITQELQGTSITSSISKDLLGEIETSVEKESQERQVEETFASDQRAERRKGEWEVMTCTGTELLKPRHAYAAALFSSQHAWYIFGGYADLGEHMGDFYCFYFPSRTWYRLPVEGEAPKCKHSATLVAAERENTLYLFGGTSEDGYLEELHSFDLQNRTWSQIKPKDGELWPPKRWSQSAAYCPQRKKDICICRS